MLKLSLHHLTINPQTNDINMFEEILEKLPELLNEFDNWFYNVEKDMTDSRHVHIIIAYKGKARFDNKTRHLKKYLFDKIIGKESKQPHFYCTSHPKDDHNKKYVSGYAGKDIMDSNRIKYSSEEMFQFIQENVQYFLDNALKIAKGKNVKDIININKNTAVCVLLNYIKKNKLELDPTIFIQMIKDGYSFVGLSKSNKRDIYIELKIHMETIGQEDESELMQQWLQNPDDQDASGYLLFLRETQDWDRLRDWFKSNKMWPDNNKSL